MEEMSTPAIDPKRYAGLLARSLPRVIETEKQHARMLTDVEHLMRKGGNRSPEEDALLELMVVLIENFEEKHYRIPEANPQDMLEHLLQERGLRPSDLWPVLGSKSRVSEILSGKRSISKDQAKKLAAFFKVPVNLFI